MSLDRRILAVISLIGLAACVHADQAVAPSGDAATFYEGMAVRDPVVNMSLQAPNDTFQIHVDAHFGDGAPIPDPVLYQPSDSTVTVSPTGLVTAHFVTTNRAKVVVRLTHGGVSRSDTVRIQVRNTIPTTTPRHITLSAPSGGSAWLSALDTVGLPSQLPLNVVVSDASGNPILSPDVSWQMRSSDTNVVHVDSLGVVTAKYFGQATITVQSELYGVSTFDSIAVTVGVPAFGATGVRYLAGSTPTSATLSLTRDTIRIAAGGQVTWENDSTQFVRVIFDNPAAVLPAPYFIFPATTGGNIDSLGAGGIDINQDIIGWYQSVQRARAFPVAGAYPYRVVPRDSHVTAETRGVVLVCLHTSTTCVLP